MNARDALFPTSPALDDRERRRRHVELLDRLIADAKLGGTLDEIRARGEAIIAAARAANGGVL